MNALLRLATRRPVLFGLLISLLILVFYTVTAILASVVASGRAGYEQMEAIGRLAASLFFLYLLWKFGWLESAGVTKRGSLLAWGIALIVLAYDLITTSYALFGSVALPGFSDPIGSASVAVNALLTGPLEEIPFRGIVLYAFLRLWGDSRRGVIGAVLYSSLLFGAIHIIHMLLGRPAPQAILVVLGAFLSGITYAALVLRWKTLWTVVVLHGVTNAVVAMRALETPGFTETVPGLALMIVLQLPLVVYGVYLIYRYAKSASFVSGHEIADPA
jgi:membrane protease YdiL (CAAX protease family)